MVVANPRSRPANVHWQLSCRCILYALANHGEGHLNLKLRFLGIQIWQLLPAPEVR
jgi:hypothetical protein